MSACGCPCHGGRLGTSCRQNWCEKCSVPRYALRYLPTDPYGRGGVVVGEFPTQEHAELIRRACPGAEFIEVVPA